MFLIVFLFCLSPLYAQNAPTNQQVEVKVRSSNLQFGKPFEVDYAVPPPIVEILSLDTNTPDGGRTSVVFAGSDGAAFRIQASAYSVRPYAFPSLRVTALDDTGSTNVFYTPSFTVPISNAMESNTNALNLIDIEPVPFVWNHLWTILIAIAAGVIALIVYLTRFRKSAAPAPKPAEDPFGVLQRRLKTLRARKDALTEETYKEFFVELSDITRELLSLTVAPLAMESPTREILELLKKHRVSDRLFDAARIVLRTCDAAKYAKAVFPRERIDEAVNLTGDLWKQAPRPVENKDAP